MMINFAKLSKTPPRRRMAAALRGFGIGNAYSTAQHLRSLGATLNLAPTLATAPVASAPAPRLSLTTTSLVNPRLAPASIPTVTMQAPTLTRVTTLQAPAPRLAPTLTLQAPAPRLAPRLSLQAPTYIRPPLTVEPERSQVEDSQPSEWTYGSGRQEEYIPPVETESAEPDWSNYSGDSGSSASADSGGGGGGETYGSAVESVPTDAERESGIKSVTGSSALAQSGGLMAQLSALPMPVKVIGGLALAYVVWQVVK